MKAEAVTVNGVAERARARESEIRVVASARPVGEGRAWELGRTSTLGRTELRPICPWPSSVGSPEWDKAKTNFRRNATAAGEARPALADDAGRLDLVARDVGLAVNILLSANGPHRIRLVLNLRAGWWQGTGR